ncbi:MAG: alpha/beta hydrolase [Thioploca sp.]|nr:alpha/beta hydrolase [Thioploca sp.]
MKTGLGLCGYACTPWIWHRLIQYLTPPFDLQLVTWPTALLPHFHQVSDFVNWLIQDEKIKNYHYDFILGHSMGGVIAIQIAAFLPKIEQIILLDSFVTPPTRFFQNRFEPSISKELQNQIINMLNLEREHYSPKLPDNLRAINLSHLFSQLNCKITALYGDRGYSDLKQLTSQLRWSSELLNKIALYFVSHANHFPMLENPQETAKILYKILDRS